MIRKKIYRQVENIYEYINNEEDARVCKEISDKACRYTPKNYFLILVSQTLTSLGDTLSNPKTVLAWLMNYVGSPLFLIGFIVPIRESGSMLPQIFIASYIRRKPIRKWVWVIGSMLQFGTMIGIGVIALNFKGASAGWLITLFLVLFSLSRGLCSVASKDVMGKTIPKTRRGRLKGYTSSISGILVLFAGLYMIFRTQNESEVGFFAWIIFIAASMWLLASLVYSNITEEPGDTEGGGNAIKEAIGRLDLIVKDKPFRNFVISRALLLCSALTAPFYIVLAQDILGTDVYILGLFIVANGLASILSAPFWGRLADTSSKGVMVRAAIITASVGILMFVAITWIPFFKNANWFYPVVFFILGIAHSGVRLGRKTYILDLAGGNRRTDYVAVSNTIIGLLLLITGGISALASLISPEGIILVLSLFGIIGAWSSAKLPKVE